MTGARTQTALPGYCPIQLSQLNPASTAPAPTRDVPACPSNILFCGAVGLVWAPAQLGGIDAVPWREGF